MILNLHTSEAMEKVFGRIPATIIAFLWVPLFVLALIGMPIAWALMHFWSIDWIAWLVVLPGMVAVLELALVIVLIYVCEIIVRGVE